LNYNFWHATQSIFTFVLIFEKVVKTFILPKDKE